jgi:(p)ppGpp synthase/HD superfamily hydrolase
VRLGTRFADAMVFAADRHGDQSRKGTQVPYVSHLLGTCAIALEAGADEDEAIAALLHDTLEDGKAGYEELVDRFGRRVADIVRECSDSEVLPKPPWRERKQAYLASIPHHSRSGMLVSNADKLHNAKTILSDYLRHGEEVWQRFDPASDQLSYYNALADAFARAGSPLADELSRVVDELNRVVAAHRAVGER